MNCGFVFKNQKSNKDASGESENEFTIFATVGAHAEAVSGTSSSDMNFHEPLSGEVMSNSQETLLKENDSFPEPDARYIQESGEFELDLSGMDIESSDDWVIGATLTEDLAEISNFGVEDSAEDSTQELNEIAVQGLGFDTTEANEPLVEETATTEEQNPSLDPEPTILDEEMAVQEMEPYVSKNEIKVESATDAISDNSEDISLETELELEIKDSESAPESEVAESDEDSNNSLELQDNSLELDPVLELEELDLALETESPEDDNAPQSESQSTDEISEDPDPKKDTE